MGALVGLIVEILVLGSCVAAGKTTDDGWGSDVGRLRQNTAVDY
jgi:hypothetical protein